MRILYFALLLTLCIVQSQAQIIINEISYNPPEAGNDSLEYIELYNSGNTQIEITGWSFTSGIGDTFPEVHLQPGAYFVAAINASAMQAVFQVNAHQWSSGALNNSGESIILVDASGNFVDSVAYDDMDPWPTDADGSGPSLELKSSTLDNNDGANWQLSGGLTGVIINGNEVKGTPGAENAGGLSGGPAVTVSVAHLEFTPQHAVVAVGDSVRWVNEEAIPHNVNGRQSTYPDNSESFFSGAPSVGPWQFDYEFTVPGLNDYQCDAHVNSGMRGTVAVYDPNGFTEFPVAHLRLTDGTNGQHIFTGVPTSITGVVHGINFLPTGYSFYIIDENNVGINVFSFDPGSYTVVEGDELRVEGVIEVFNGLLEIVPSNITVLSSGNALTTPEIFTALDESTEGSHIVLSLYTLDSIVATGATGYNVYVKDEQGTDVLIRVDADLGLSLDEIQNANVVRGIGTQFDNSFPFTSGYQILALEFEFLENVPVIGQDAIAMTPNPATQSVSFSTDYSINSIDIYSMDGRMILSKSGSGETSEINISSLFEGLYMVKANTAIGVWTSVLAVVR